MPRNADEFIQLTDEDFSWRRQELTTLKLNIQSQNNGKFLDILCRSATCLLYSHWEGFIKKSSDLYIQLIEKQGFDLSNLKPVYASVNLYGTLKSCAASNKISMYNSAIESVVNSHSQKFKIGAFKFEVEGNLNYERLFEILLITQTNNKLYELNRTFIDEQLLATRNVIAHGERKIVSREDYIYMHEKLLDLLNNFKTAIQNCAVTQTYKL